jgi:hypothetical protein
MPSISSVATSVIALRCSASRRRYRRRYCRNCPGRRPAGSAPRNPGQPHQRVVDRLVAVRVEVTHHVADDLGAFLVRAGGSSPVAHGVEDAAMHRLQAVARIGQRAVHDGRQRIGQIALLERLFQVDALNVIAAAGRYQAFSHGAGLEEALIRGKRCRHLRHQEEISVRLSISTRPVRRHDGAIDRKHLNIDQRQGKTPMMHLTGLYCVPLALMMSSACSTTGR